MRDSFGMKGETAEKYIFLIKCSLSTQSSPNIWRHLREEQVRQDPTRR